MSGILRDIQNKREWYKLRCEKGVWKTGYEDIGLNVTDVCFPKGLNVPQLGHNFRGNLNKALWSS